MTTALEMQRGRYDRMLLNLHRALRASARKEKNSFRFLELFRGYEGIWRKRCAELGESYDFNDPDRFREHAFDHAKAQPNTVYSMTLKGVKNILVTNG